ncbi:hypothetical protein CVIRNUC_002267 [Coccomyxa viridis]|uniref:Uncharacterized protein n=1 Tax=Coccomyxa viridis TaxID=1274662 RepID=A0AAV1HXZ4_9CHLO|nr:hypothetical protein CVIRNUC_002267 [Coccomyxa viridis]
MLQTGTLNGGAFMPYTLQTTFNSLPPLPSDGSNSASSYSSNGTNYSLSREDDGLSYQESGILSAPGGQIMTAAPSSGPGAGIITAARISTGNLASSEPGMDEPADYNIPDAPDPAGQSDLVQDPTTTGNPVILNPSFGEGTAEDKSIG